MTKVINDVFRLANQLNENKIDLSVVKSVLTANNHIHVEELTISVQIVAEMMHAGNVTAEQVQSVLDHTTTESLADMLYSLQSYKSSTVMTQLIKFLNGKK